VTTAGPALPRISYCRCVQLVEIRRYPVKSLLGEVLPSAAVGERGLAGDRLWAVRDPDGKFGSGKNTRRFRRMPGLFTLRARAAPSHDDPGPRTTPPAGVRGASDPPAPPARVRDNPDPSTPPVPVGDVWVPSARLVPVDDVSLPPGPPVPLASSVPVRGLPTPAVAGPGVAVPIVELPDGRCFAADDHAGHLAISELLGRQVTLTPESGIPHHDEGPVSLITTNALRTLTALTGGGPDGVAIDPQRFRANLLIDVPDDDEAAFPEAGWPGRRLRIGPDVVLRVLRPLIRCVMIDMRQDTAPERNDLLKTLAAHHDMTFGVVATVEHPGHLRTGDVCSWS
jgi:uncharacterized protein YcbX